MCLGTDIIASLVFQENKKAARRCIEQLFNVFVA